MVMMLFYVRLVRRSVVVGIVHGLQMLVHNDVRLREIHFGRAV